MGDFSLTWREAWVNFAQPALLVALGAGAALLTLVAACNWLQWLGNLAPCPVDPGLLERAQDISSGVVGQRDPVRR